MAPDCSYERNLADLEFAGPARINRPEAPRLRWMVCQPAPGYESGRPGRGAVRDPKCAVVGCNGGFRRHSPRHAAVRPKNVLGNLVGRLKEAVSELARGG